MPMRKSRKIRSRSRSKHRRKKSVRRIRKKSRRRVRKSYKKRSRLTRRSRKRSVVRRSRKKNIKKYNYRLSGSQKRKRSQKRKKAATKIQALQRQQIAKSRIRNRRLLAENPQDVYSTQEVEPSYIWSRITPYLSRKIESSHKLPDNWVLEDLNFTPKKVRDMLTASKSLITNCRIKWIENPRPPHPFIEKLFNTDSFYIQRSHAGGIMDIRPKESIIKKWVENGDQLVYDLMDLNIRHKINMMEFQMEFRAGKYSQIYKKLMTYDFHDKIMTLSNSELHIFSIHVPLLTTYPQSWMRDMYTPTIKIQWAREDDFYKIFQYGYNVLLPIWDINFAGGTIIDKNSDTMIVDLTNHINEFFRKNKKIKNAKYILQVGFGSKRSGSGHSVLIAIEDENVYGCDPNGFDKSPGYKYSKDLSDLMKIIGSKCNLKYGGMLEELNPGCHNTSIFQLTGLVCKSWTTYLALLIAMNPSVKVPAIFDYHAVKGYSREYLMQRAVFIVMYLFERFAEFIRDKKADDRFFQTI